MKKKVRWQLLIYPRFQLTLLLIEAIVISSVFFFIIVQASRSYRKLRELGEGAGLAATHSYFKVLELQFQNLQTHLLIAFGVGFLVSALATLALSNRLAGPIVRMTEYFKRINETGEWSESNELHFRKGDFFSELPPLINKARKNAAHSNKS
jgi:hypothetical protein